MEETLYNVYHQPKREHQLSESTFMGQFWGILERDAVAKVTAKFGNPQKGFHYLAATAGFELDSKGKVVRYFDPVAQARLEKSRK